MTNKEQIQKDLAVAFDFIEHIIDNPDVLDKIPDWAEINFLDDENVKPEKKKKRDSAKNHGDTENTKYHRD